MRGGNPAIRPDQANQLPRSRAGSGPAPQSAFVVAQRVIVFGPNGGIFLYAPAPATGNLVGAQSAAAGTDPYGNKYFAGFGTYTASAGVSSCSSLLSTSPPGFFQYANPVGGVQGALILSVASAAGTDPVDGGTYPAGVFGVNPSLGSTLTGVGAVILLNVAAFTQAAENTIGLGSGAAGPALIALAPEQGQSGHAVLFMTGTSPDGTQPAQLIMASKPTGLTTPTPATKALVEVQGDIAISIAGNGLRIKEGSNARMGTATLNGTTNVVVANTTITAATRIFLTTDAAAGTLGNPVVVSRSVGVSFTIKSTVAGDTSGVAWLLVEPA